MVQIPPQVCGELRGRAIPSVALALQRLYRDTIEIALELACQLFRLRAARRRGGTRRIRVAAELGARTRRLLLAQLAQPYIERRFLAPLRLEGLQPREQHIQNHRERVHVRARIDVLDIWINLLWAHVARSPQELPNARVQRLFHQLHRGGFGKAKIDDPWLGLAVHLHDQDIGRLQIAMDNGLLVRMLHPLADADEELQPLGDLEPVLIAILRDRQPGDILHDQVRLTLGCRPSIEHLGDRRMIHDRERLALRLKPPYHHLVVHPRPDQLQGHQAAHGQGLLGQPYLPHAAFAEPADQLETLAKLLPLGQTRSGKRVIAGPKFRRRRRPEELGTESVADRQQRLQLHAQRRIRRADLVEKLGTRLRVERQGLVHQLFDLSPTGRAHSEPARLILRRNQIRAVAQSRSTVARSRVPARFRAPSDRRRPSSGQFRPAVHRSASTPPTRRARHRKRLAVPGFRRARSEVRHRVLPPGGCGRTAQEFGASSASRSPGIHCCSSSLT